MADSWNIQDKRHLSVAHNRRSGVTRQSLQLFAQRLDHNFLGVVYTIYYQAELSMLRLQNDDVANVAGITRAELQNFVQISNWQQSTTSAINRHIVHVVNFGRRIVFESNEFKQAHLRDDETLAATANEKARNNSKRKRDFQFYGGTQSRNTDDINCAADFFDV